MIGTTKIIKKFIRVAIGRDFYISKDCNIDHEKFGSQYGGWNIALGYLDASSIVYSVGVGEDASFDIALIDEFGVTINAFDPTPKSIKWVNSQKFCSEFKMHEYGMAASDGELILYPPENPDHVSHSIFNREKTKSMAITVQVKRLKTIMDELQHEEIDVLKMDIEGSEYSVIKDIASTNVRPKQLLIEFHHRFPSIGIKKTKGAIKLVRKMGYELFSVSDTQEEYSFIHEHIIEPDSSKLIL